MPPTMTSGTSAPVRLPSKSDTYNYLITFCLPRSIFLWTPTVETLWQTRVPSELIDSLENTIIWIRHARNDAIPYTVNASCRIQCPKSACKFGIRTQKFWKRFEKFCVSTGGRDDLTIGRLWTSMRMKRMTTRLPKKENQQRSVRVSDSESRGCADTVECDLWRNQDFRRELNGLFSRPWLKKCTN